MKFSKLIQKINRKKDIKRKSETWKLKGHKYMLKILKFSSTQINES